MLRLLQDIRAELTPLQSESTFAQNGMISAQEFVISGDHLVAINPIWRWVGCKTGARKPYLPREKQYLAVNGVASHASVDDKEGGLKEDDWLDASNDDDMELILIDKQSGKRAPEEGVQRREGGSTVAAARKYDITITYDRYYRTPRFWFALSYEVSSSSSPRSIASSEDTLLTDFCKDYVKATVTVETHPYIPTQNMHATVHPCFHASAMTSLLARLKEKGGEKQTSARTGLHAGESSTGPCAFRVEQYMPLFLRMIQSIVDIDYDFATL
jgi:ubiquitin-like-conjugating enzyme ATG3